VGRSVPRAGQESEVGLSASTWAKILPLLGLRITGRTSVTKLHCTLLSQTERCGKALFSQSFLLWYVPKIFLLLLCLLNLSKACKIPGKNFPLRQFHAVTEYAQLSR